MLRDPTRMAGVERAWYPLEGDKGTHCNLPRPESPNPKKYVSLFVQKTTKSEPFAFPPGGR